MQNTPDTPSFIDPETPLRFSAEGFELPSELPTEQSRLTTLLQTVSQAANTTVKKYEDLITAERMAYETKLAAQQIDYETSIAAKQADYETSIAAKQADCETSIAAKQMACDARILDLEQAFQARLIELYEQIQLARRRMFGPSSEHIAQLHLFNEAEISIIGSTDAQDQAIIPAPVAVSVAPKAGRGQRRPLPDTLERVDIYHDLPESERVCACDSPMAVINTVISEQLDIIPMQIRVLRHIRRVYGCPTREHAPVTAALPPQPLPKSNASPAFLAMLLTTKYVDGLPLARFEKVLNRHGVEVSRQTLARWVMGCAEVLQPMLNLVRDELLESPVIHMDETVVQVLKEKGKSPTSQSYMWVQAGETEGHRVVVYDYESSRSSEVPARLLQGYQGYLMTDGYEGYNRIANTEGVEHLVCWAHVRRKFVEAVKVQPKGTQGHADQAIALIGKLYGIERAYKKATDEERYAARQALSQPVLASLHDWMEALLPRVLPKSVLGVALNYLNNYWDKLIRYIERGDLPIDNNQVENCIRPFVIGRKNWLFSDTAAGAHASAVVYSLVETAKVNGVEPYFWLCQVLEQLPAAKSLEDMVKLLPWNLHAATLGDNATIG